MKAAIARATLDRPYYATALWALKLVAVEGLAASAPGPAGVDEKWRLYYDPDVVAQWPIGQRAFLVIHEVEHLLRRHADRCRAMGAESMRWNIAADLEINSGKQHSGSLELPQGVLVPGLFGLPEGLLAEEYYQRLPSDGCAKGSPNEGSGVHGVAQPWEAAGEGRAAVDAVERQQIARATEQALREHAKVQGDVPDDLRRELERLNAPRRVDWRRVLARMVRHAIGYKSGYHDYSYRKPSRRWNGGELILPSMVAPVVSVAVVLDTSGSMGSTTLVKCVAQIERILEAVGQPAWFLSVDAAVHVRRRIHSAREVAAVGGGGTDMGLGIAEAAKLRPALIIVLTDGWTPWGARPARARVVVALTDASRRDGVPSWATVVMIDDS